MKIKLLSLLSIAISAISYGQTYTTQNSGIPVQSFGAREYSIVDPTTAWITYFDGAGTQTYPKYVGVTTNGGTNWKANLVSNLPSNALISDVGALNGTTAFIVTAPASGSGTANGLWKTTNGGTNWAKVSGVFSNGSFGNIVHFFDANNGLVIGDPLNGKYEMYKTTDGGNTWTTLSTAPSPLTNEEYGYVAGRVFLGEDLWLTSSTGRILHTKDRGMTWDSYFSPVDDFSGESSSANMSFSSSTYGLLVDNTGLLWYTEDGGENWDLKTASNYYDGDLSYIPGSDGVFISTGFSTESSLGTGSSYTNDNGATWTKIDEDIQRLFIGAYDCESIWVGHYTSDTSGTGGVLKLNGIPGCSLSTNEQTVSKVELKAVVNGGVLNMISNKEIKSVLVGDLTGRRLAEVNAKNVNISALKAGVYFARVAYADGSYGTVKFIVK
ncbi:T9SS type A sorting domain-containing protein [Empedobacter brevis]|uniref:T9SS type A sorting domain-containing protein n=1 Tax=Empedobacter brevis TaxID=247 RepID=UPI0023F37087|nr:T9SS type A sorting domain-containing protein [Empedobacter brevis]